jgi:ABC-type transport system substrate-binding protein
VGHCNEEFDRLTTLGDTTIDPAQRLANYEEAQRLLVADVPAVFVFNSVGLSLVKPNVSGITPTAMEAVWPGSRSSQMTIDKTD